MNSSKVLALFLLLLLVFPLQARADAKNKTAPPITLTGKVDVLASYLAGAGLEIESRSLPTLVLKVRKGSPAFYGGVDEGDRILEGAIKDNRLYIKIERKGKIYLVKLRAKKAPTPTLTGKDRRQTLKAGHKTGDYHLVILLDRSGSMVHSLGDRGVSRWSWLAKEIKDFAARLEQQDHARFDLGLFNESCVFVPDIDASKTKTLIDSTITTGSTDLLPALAKASRHYQKKAEKKEESRPLLVLVFTDGIDLNQNPPEEGARSALGEFLHSHFPKDRISIVLFQAGFSEEGSRFVSRFNEEAGGSCIKTVLFEKIREKGLYESLPELLQQD
ncbi:VWA domain-containing protein [bacterium]|nr:VWA domain-containing protein [bacterium]